jgi:N6-adenosine-specific RNA methylase IME4
MTWPFGDLEPGKYGAILADPPWKFETWGSQDNAATFVDRHYETMSRAAIEALPVAQLSAKDSVLFLWVTWPTLVQAITLIERWGFTYKTCAFCWMKANALQIEMFRDDITAHMTTGYWTRSNSEVCLLASRGKPKRLNADVRQGIIAPRREHSRKPDGIHERIERLVAGPYVELFARQRRSGWDSWGNETDKFKPREVASGEEEYAAALAACREAGIMDPFAKREQT